MSTTNITKKRATTSTSQVETPNKRLKQEEEAEGGPEKQQDSEKPMSVEKTKDQDQDQEQDQKEDQKEDQVHKVQEFPQFVRSVMQKLLQLEADFKDGKCSPVSLMQQILDINAVWTLTCDKILKDNAVKTLNEWVRKYDNMEEFHKTLEYISDLRDRYELNRKYDNMEEFHKTLEYILDLRDRYN